MTGKLRNIAKITAVVIFLTQLLFFKSLFVSTMPLHVAVHIPLLVFLGLILGTGTRINTKYPLAILIFTMASLMAYMLPYLTDLSAIILSVNIIRQFHLLLCGILIAIALPQAIIEVQIAFLGMLTSTTAATGIAMQKFNILLCSAFSIPQQQKTGTWLLYISGILFIITLLNIFWVHPRRQSE